MDIRNRFPKEQSDQAKPSPRETIVDREDAPEFLCENKYMSKGYRVNYNSFTKILKSLFQCHNETVNIWTHLFGALAALLLVFYIFVYFDFHLNDFILQKWTVKQASNTPVSLENVLKDADEQAFKQFKEEKAFFEFKFDVIKEKFSEICTDLDEHASRLFDKVKQEATEFKDFLLENEYVETLKRLENRLEEIIKASHVWELSEEMIQTVKTGWHLFSCEDKGTNSLSVIPIYVFLLSGAACLGFSALFHLFSAYSSKAYTILNKLDYSGISLLIAGSCYPPYYYYLYCNPMILKFYLGLITTFSSICFVISLDSRFGTPEWQKFRGLFFILLGISAGAPFFHKYAFPSHFAGFDKEPEMMLFWPIGGVIYIVGALIYISRFPERQFPGMFDFIVLL